MNKLRIFCFLIALARCFRTAVFPIHGPGTLAAHGLHLLADLHMIVHLLGTQLHPIFGAAIPTLAPVLKGVVGKFKGTQHLQFFMATCPCTVYATVCGRAKVLYALLNR